MVDAEVLERIAARRAELDSLEEQLVSNWARCGPSETNSQSPSGFWRV